MNKIVVAIATAAVTAQVVKARQFAKNNPDNPAIIDARQSRENLKASLKNLKNEIKRSWKQSDTDLKFKKIIDEEK